MIFYNLVIMPKSDGMWFLTVIAIMFALWLSSGAIKKEAGSIPNALVGEKGLLSIGDGNSPRGDTQENLVEDKSSYRNIRLHLGNIRSARYPEDQYVYLTNRGWRATEPVYVGGWILENGSLSSTKNKKRIVLPASAIEYYNPYSLTGNVKSPLALYQKKVGEGYPPQKIT